LGGGEGSDLPVERRKREKMKVKEVDRGVILSFAMATGCLCLTLSMLGATLWLIYWVRKEKKREK